MVKNSNIFFSIGLPLIVFLAIMELHLCIAKKTPKPLTLRPSKSMEQNTHPLYCQDLFVGNGLTVCIKDNVFQFSN